VIKNSGRFLTAPDLTGAVWKKSTHSGGGEAQCVEVADVVRSHCGIAVRDSKDASGAALLFTPAAFADFLADVSAGRFDV
jgi:hypothetical protein